MRFPENSVEAARYLLGSFRTFERLCPLLVQVGGDPDKIHAAEAVEHLLSEVQEILKETYDAYPSDGRKAVRVLDYLFITYAYHAFGVQPQDARSRLRSLTPTWYRFGSNDETAQIIPTEILTKIKEFIDSQIKKETKIMTTAKIVDTNVSAAKAAALNEAGRIANVKLSQIVSKSAPLMVRGYIETPIGHLVVANAFKMAVGQFQPDNSKAVLLADAMLAQAYQGILQHFDIEGILNEFLDDSKITKALPKVVDKPVEPTKAD